MLCDKCKQRPATVHFTKIVNNEKYEQHLCDECAKGVPHFGFGGDPNFSLNKFLAHLLTNDPALSGLGLTYKTERCENCGLTYSQFSQGGKLGCSNCYHVFREKLDPLLRRIHSSEYHKGKVPERTGGKLKLLKEMESLKNELGVLVSREEFEKAAEVRDKIKDLEKKMGS
ncbi:UvrB/UvrC motif-containing protein [Candidatus Formimonas warabiya]|uniref:UVR domain-containing protein n=1 Tax=Formimonas warabiya TaxID=1761012 RepID=A0A3G1KXA5_FORW1|nr:UvrB/UvrC motif-containing protein [Candidatus Formimonas warabiya]ATW27072.1 hypothetical protein DCMF_22015 [Candidatus Formimonas warabiya]